LLAQSDLKAIQDISLYVTIFFTPKCGFSSLTPLFLMWTCSVNFFVLPLEACNYLMMFLIAWTLLMRMNCCMEESHLYHSLQLKKINSNNKNWMKGDVVLQGSCQIIAVKISDNSPWIREVLLSAVWNGIACFCLINLHNCLLWKTV